MQFISVSSSWLRRYAYDSGDLYIEYKSGVMCHYANVPLSIWTGLLGAASKGKYVWSSGLYYWPYTII